MVWHIIIRPRFKPLVYEAESSKPCRSINPKSKREKERKKAGIA